MERWPTPADLAREPKSEVIKAWGRLGYPRRAIRLHESAKVITFEYQNQVPRYREELLALPGVGDYTASAIAAFAYGESALVLDVNIRRFFTRYFEGRQFPTSSPSQIEKKLRSELIPTQRGDTWAAATMEFGALICTSRSPNCTACFLAKDCAWRAAGYPEMEIKRQAKFEGSDRQCRGVIMKVLKESDRATKAALLKQWPVESQLESALKTLIADGLIETTGKSFTLAS